MAAQLGVEFVLKIHDGAATYNPVGGFRSNNFTINGARVDITNKDSGAYTEALEGAGFLGLSTSASGVFMDDAAFADVHGHLLARTHPLAQIFVPDWGTYEGKLAITSLEMAGEQDGEITYSISLENAGDMPFTAL